MSYNTKCILEAHRGLSTDYPENTMSAFRAAEKSGYIMIELDTKFTLDDRCVILHDRTVNRTARNPDGSKLERETPISSLTLAQAQALDYGVWFGERFKGEPLCTLGEALDFALEKKIPLKFDSVLFSHTESQREIFFGAIESRNALGLVGFTCGNLDCVKIILARFSSAAIHYEGLVNDETMTELYSMAGKDQFTVWLRMDNDRTSWCRTAPAGPELVKTVRSYGKLGLWLLDKPSELDTAINEYRADIVETDGSLKP